MLELARSHSVGKARDRGDGLRLSEVHPGAVLRGRALERVSRGDERPYGVAKKSILVGANAYREQYGLDAIFLLPANLYGPRDNFDLASSHVIPALIRKMVDADGDVTFGATRSPTREFLYVDDRAEALLLAAERYDAPAPVNLGTGVETSIRTLAETIAELTGFNGEVVWDTDMPNGQPRRSLDASRARERSTSRRGTLRDGLEKTIAWYRASSAVNA